MLPPASRLTDDLRQRFRRPSAASRPTPLYWWSGGDIDRDRLAWQLTELSARGIGGTIVGYSHRPDGDLDHGDPEPLSPEWWNLFRWFVSASAERGMTVGVQDYGIIGGILLRAAERTRGSGAGSLENDTEMVTGPAVITRDVAAGTVLSRRALGRAGSEWLDAATVDAGRVTWTIPEGEWLLSTVRVVPGKIGRFDTDFDPLHPAAAEAVIDLFYRRFADELGEQFGTTFTTFFQDELDLGLVMPMWNSLVGEELERRGFTAEHRIHWLWHGEGDAVMGFRAAYRDIVVGLLEEHYFRPIFEWLDARSVMIVMDQMSRGDLRLGRKHYGDFLQTMRWFHGPGNDDPGLERPRSVAAFRTSASIAHLHGRPLVTNEAFHSSGWGVTPDMVVGGLNVSFAAGANQIMLHGLDYTIDGGWWEWASPDFHFRQPWWAHSTPLWAYIARVGEMMRAGVPVSDVAIVDPTQDLDFDDAADSPETARRLIVELGAGAINADLVPQAYLADSAVREHDGVVELVVLQASYRAIVLPGLTVIRRSALDALTAFVEGGGVVVAVGHLPSRTEVGELVPADTVGWHRVDDRPDALADALRQLVDTDLDVADALMHAHRRVGDTDLYFVVNHGESAIDADCGFRMVGRLERWDPWTGEMREVEDARVVADHRGVKRLRTRVTLEPEQSLLLFLTPGEVPAERRLALGVERERVGLDTGWRASVSSAMDRRFADHPPEGAPIEVTSWHLESSQDARGPWSPALAGHGVRFWALGPVREAEAAQLDALLPTLSQVDPTEPPLEGAPSWRPYALSFDDGLEQDPYLLDGRTGPHGLKGVPGEFLDPRFLDESPEPGSTYYFWSTVESGGESTTLASQGRCAHTVWVDGALAVTQPEASAEYFPPWSLRDMSAVERASAVELLAGENVVVVKVVVSADQPSRVAAVVGGTRPEHPEGSRLLWWQGADPAREYAVGGATDELVWLRVAIPVGAVAATIRTEHELVDAAGGAVTVVDGGYRVVPAAGSHLTFAVRGRDAGALSGPITWSTGPAEVDETAWRELGLLDFSGVVRYEREVLVDVQESRRIDLVLSGLEGSAEVTVNGALAGTLYRPTASVRIDTLVAPGPNLLRIAVANTLVNLYAHLPSPFAAMQAPGGGFTGAELVYTRPE